MKPSVGMIGLGVMGANLARNIERNGYAVAVYDRNQAATAKLIENFKSAAFVPAGDYKEFVHSLERPRQIFILVNAGATVDAVIDELLPLVEEGDIIIDGGNSYYEDTTRREKRCAQKKAYFMGVGVSGGEEGALNGPSIMPGGDKKAWEVVAPLLAKIAAKVEGRPCTAYIGPDGAGHYVKMVHNGIEYGDMQLIAEAYHLLRIVLDAPAPELAAVFEEWNRGVLSSYLIEITAKVLKRRDDHGEGYLVDRILDKAGQTGTGKWTAMEGLKLGVAIPTLSAAVDARVLSAMKDERLTAAKHFTLPCISMPREGRTVFIKNVHDALYCSKIMAYAQGMALLGAASREYGWNLNLAQIASIWKGGCIIRARFLDEICRAYAEDPALINLMLTPAMKREIESYMCELRTTLRLAAQAGIPIPAFSASLSYFDSYRSPELPQNLTQAQRDFFGAHTYERKDRAGVFHTVWE